MKYKVDVTIRAEVTYTVEVEAPSEARAEDEATGQWRSQMPDDFQVEKGYITDWDVENTEQLSWECSECEAEITEAQSKANDELCDACNEAEKAKDAASTARRITALVAKGITIHEPLSGRQALLDEIEFRSKETAAKGTTIQ